MLVDIHFHTYVYSPDELKVALQDIEDNELFLCSVTCDIPDWVQTREICSISPRIIPMFGIHPEKAPLYFDNLSILNPYMEEALMFGEIGLDHNWISDSSQYGAQEKLLSYFLESAEREGKPVMLHTNGAEDEVLALLETHSITKAIFHDYDCSVELFKRIVDNGYYISIGRVILEEYKARVANWEHFLELAKETPEDLLLTETDGPPRDRRMPHSLLVEVVERLAVLRMEPFEETASAGVRNFKKIIHDDSRFESYLRYF
ncbi:MAG: TatD family hydrolase [Candidatus Thorarchaeota archaeon]